MPTVDSSMQALSAAMQDLMVGQFRQLNHRLEALSKSQNLMQEEVRKVNESMMELRMETKQGAAEREIKENQKEAKLTPAEMAVEGVGSMSSSSPHTTPRSGLNTRKSMRHSHISGGMGKSAPEDKRGSGAERASTAANDDIVRIVTSQASLGAGKAIRDNSCLGYIRRFMALDVKGKESVMDAIMGVLIVVNAVTIGISMDYSGPVLYSIDLFFTISFISELTLKCCMKGVCGHFCGEGAASNIFDACLVFIDLAQLIIGTFFADTIGKSMEGSPSASLFRVVRLVRLVRLLRLLRLGIFKDLISMITGMIGGASTLLWSIVLFALIVYVFALLFREFFGREDKENIYDYFSTVPRSMFTVFRCSFGDCSSSAGVPIFEHITTQYGGVYSLLYCLFTFVIAIGLFNVISAIFVESTMAAALASELAKKQDRISDKGLWEREVAVLMAVFMEHAGCTKKLSVTESAFATEVSNLVELEIDPDKFTDWIHDERVSAALDALDINPDDHAYLFDILDCDNSGAMFVSEVIDGIARLRGEPRRSDIITVDLMVRSIQMQCNSLVSNMEKVTEHLGLPVTKAG